MKINIIVATDFKNGIGKSGSIPWRCKEDMNHFKKTTIGNRNNAVIMGRKTMESIPNYLLPNRFNIIVSKTLHRNDIINKVKSNDNFIICNNIHDTLEVCYKHRFDEVWIIGGGEIYLQFLENKHYTDHIYKCIITKIYNDYDCDTFFPTLQTHTDESEHICKWKKINENKLIDNIYIEQWINELYKFNI